MFIENSENYLHVTNGFFLQFEWGMKTDLFRDGNDSNHFSDVKTTRACKFHILNPLLPQGPVKTSLVRPS